ncbi:MAG: hypothetical protein ABFD62_10250 [Syntrophaceae bacterium]
MKKISTAIALCCMVCFLFTTAAQALEFGVRGYYWFATFSGDLGVGVDNAAGTVINAKDDLGIDNENLPSVEAYFGVGRHHLSLMYTPLDYTGDAVLSRPVTFKSSVYPAGSAVHSEFKATMLDLDYQYDIVNLENVLAGFSIGPVIKVKFLDGDVKLSTTGIDNKETFTYPLPMLGLGAHVGILANILEARAKATAMGYSGNYIYDIMADLSYTPFPFLDIHGGYRYMKVKYDEENTYINTDFSGPYVALTIGF